MLSSTQINYAGQQGWNDCLPSTFLNGKRSNTSKNYIKRAHPAPPIGSSITPPLPQTNIAASKSTSSLPPPPSVSYTTTTPPPPPPQSCSPPLTLSQNVSTESLQSSQSFNSMKDSDSISQSSSSGANTPSSECSSVASIEAIKADLDLILASNTTLPTREFTHYKTRLQKFIPGLSMEHLDVVSDCLTKALKAKDEKNSQLKQEAREIIVQHMLIHNQISSWSIPLRKVIEGLDL